MAKVVDLSVIEQLVKASGIKADKAEALIASISDKATERVGVSANPPKEIDGTMHYFCRFTQKYYPKEEMVVSNGKSKGYSKNAISIWNRINAEIKKVQATISNAILKGDDINDDLKTRLAFLKDALNATSTYEDIPNALNRLGIVKESK